VTDVYLTRAYDFCAGHRLFDPQRDAEWNRRVFGKCSFEGGHGHNYRLEVTVRGEPDRDSGWVVPAAALDALVERHVLERIDHRELKQVIPLRFGPAPTTEVLLIEIWEMLAGHIPPPARLWRVRLGETAKNTFEYYGVTPEGAPAPAAGAAPPRRSEA
jgi:6-pyruvoyltetrahydropterin/6-carboxytetrahydropterin synthase